MHLINIKFSFQKTAFCKKFTFSIFFYSSSFLFEVYINLFEILYIVNVESRDSQKFAFEKKRYYHDSNIFHLNSLNQVHLNYTTFNVYLNYSKFIFIWIIRSLFSFELFGSHLHLNYSTFIFIWTIRRLKFHFNFRHSDFHFNYSITALDLMFRELNIEYRILEISVR